MLHVARVLLPKALSSG